jgi:hypothetical protein
MIITAGKGPGPSGLNSVTGIRSTAPFGAVVVMDREVAPMQPPRNKDKESVSSVDVRIALPVKEITGKYSSQNITDSKNHNCARFNFVGGELSINFRPRSSRYSRGTYDDFPACCQRFELCDASVSFGMRKMYILSRFPNRGKQRGLTFVSNQSRISCARIFWSLKFGIPAENPLGITRRTKVHRPRRDLKSVMGVQAGPLVF